MDVVSPDRSGKACNLHHDVNVHILSIATDIYEGHDFGRGGRLPNNLGKLGDF